MQPDPLFGCSIRRSTPIVKPAAFAYEAPETVEEALALLERHGEGAKVLAGGQSLVPMMNFRLAQPEVLIDINGLAELDYIRLEDRPEAGRELAIGALTRQRTAELSPLVGEHCPLLAEALGHVAHAAIRNRGTVGGSLVHADPSAEIATVLTTLDGRVTLRGPAGERTLAPGDFLLGYLTTGLAPDELLVEARFPAIRPGARWGFLEFSRRQGDFAIAAVAAMLEMDSGGACTAARIGLGGVAPAPVRALAAERALVGRRIDGDAIDEAGRLAQEACDTEGDYHASEEYKRNLAGVLTRRCLAQALERGREAA